MLGDSFDIEEFRAKYDLEYRQAFVFFILIFEQLSKTGKTDICLLAGNNVAIYHSTLGHSAWGDIRIEVWGKQWIQTNEALPDCYNDKEKIIKKTASLPWILGDIGALIDLHHKGILNPQYFDEIKKYWERVSDIPLDLLKAIAYGKY